MKELINAFNKLNVMYDDKMLSQFENYMCEILEYNKYINLTAITDRDEFIKKHFVDSIAILQSPEFNSAKRIIDVGTGGGFPGVPLAIVAPDKEFVLMDSLNKRLKIINELTEKYEIKNINTIHSRAEDLGHQKSYRENFDLAVSRAVASMPVLCEYVLPFVNIGGTFIAYKGPDILNEIDLSQKAIFSLGAKMDRIENSEVNFDKSKHNLVYIKKIKGTPKKYPRKAGIPSKEPLI